MFRSDIFSSVRFLAASLAAATLLGGCPATEDDPPSIEGRTAEESAALTTKVTCDYVARCGVAEEVCVGAQPSPVGEGDESQPVDGRCMFESIEFSVAECEAEIAEDIAEAYECAELTAADRSEIDACLAMMSGGSCVTLGDVSDDAEEAEADLPSFPGGCIEIFTELNRCTVSEGEPIPD